MAAVGSALGIFPGLFYDYFGARLTCLVAATFAFTGYFLTYLSLKHTIFTTYWLVGIYFTIIGIGASAGYTAALSTNVKNYNRKHRGKIVGVLTSLFALSSALFSLIYKYVYQQKLIDYLLFLSIAAGAVPLVGFVFLNTVERRKKVVVDSDEYSYDKKLSDEGTEVYEEDENLYLFAQNSNNRMSNQLIKTDYDSEISELLNEGVKQSAPPLRNEYNPIQMLTSIDFWLLFIGLFSSFGSGLMIMNVC
jgi:MFS family permease